MKLFFTIFAAILAAAAVILGVVAYREEEAREEAEALRSVNSMIDTASSFTSLVVERDGKVSQEISIIKFSADTFAYYLNGKLPPDANRNILLRKFLAQYETAIDAARSLPLSDAYSKNWADEMERISVATFPQNFTPDEDYAAKRVQFEKEETAATAGAKVKADAEASLAEEMNKLKQEFAPLSDKIEANLRSLLPQLSGTEQVKYYGDRQFRLYELVQKGLVISYSTPVAKEDYAETSVSILKGRITKLSLMSGENEVFIYHSEVPIQ